MLLMLRRPTVHFGVRQCALGLLQSSAKLGVLEGARLRHHVEQVVVVVVHVECNVKCLSSLLLTSSLLVAQGSES